MVEPCNNQPRGKVWIISDTHFGDVDIIKYTGRPFKSIEEMENTIITNWNKCVADNDIVYHLGDLANDVNPTYVSNIVENLKFREMYLIRGNHDNFSDAAYYHMGITKVYEYPIIIKELVILSHEPKFLEINSPYANIYGHTHQNDYVAHMGSTFYYNCCVDVTKFSPVLLGDIISQIKNRQHNKVINRTGYVNDRKRPDLMYNKFNTKPGT